jgi:hypothetical protein
VLFSENGVVQPHRVAMSLESPNEPVWTIPMKDEPMRDDHVLEQRPPEHRRLQAPI